MALKIFEKDTYKQVFISKCDIFLSELYTNKAMVMKLLFKVSVNVNKHLNRGK